MSEAFPNNLVLKSPAPKQSVNLREVVSFDDKIDVLVGSRAGQAERFLRPASAQCSPDLQLLELQQDTYDCLRRIHMKRFSDES